MKFTKRRVLAASAAALIAGVLVTGCGDDKKDDNASGSSKGGKIALLLPETKTTRYESADKPYFTDKVKELCSTCEVDYKNANQKADDQLNQANTALTNGAKVLVLDPVDGKAAASIVAAAKAKNVPVISYDRLTTGNPDYYISFDNKAVGKAQGEALVKAMKEKGKANGNVVMINGSATDPNAADFKAGAQEALKAGGATIAKDYDTPDWSPDKAQSEMQAAITAVGKDKIDGVLAANDGTAGGAYAAMKAAGFTTFPPMTGQDAETAGLQRIVAGTQYMTIYKPIKPEAEDAATLAVQLVRGETPSISGKQFTDFKGSKAVILDPITVTKANIMDTVVKDKFVKVSELCTGEFAKACTDANIK